MPKKKITLADLENYSLAIPDSIEQQGEQLNESWDMPQGQQIPLQVLKQDDLAQGYYTSTYEERMQRLLEATARADQHWRPLYARLCDRMKSLATVLEDGQYAVIIADFTGSYTRVGGLPGFWERLLPAMHPVYGVPYVPASSIKGVIRAWARNSGQAGIDSLLGYVDDENNAAIAAVQVLDAFLMQHCLSVDVATPQWEWNGELVKYNPSPHQLLSLKDLKLQIGLRQTSKGTVDQVKIVLGWLRDALLSEGLGSRTSSSYGQVEQVTYQGEPFLLAQFTGQFTKCYPFKFWSQGMYGAPQKQEFRGTAVRGVLRYWLRSIALGLFPPSHCKVLEDLLFGTLKPKARQGHYRISVKDLIDQPGDLKKPHYATGEIVLEARTEAELKLLEQLLKLATHLGGVGRGARRPLHINKRGEHEDLRGCYWQLEPTVQLVGEKAQWEKFLKELRAQLRTVKTQAFTMLNSEELAELEQSKTLEQRSPGSRGNRLQDVINSKTRIYLLKTPNVELPSDNLTCRGAGLEFLYNSGYKGESPKGQGKANANVGGSFKPPCPSFVWIASNCLHDPDQAYQVVTVFGADQSDRAEFCQKLKEKYKTPILTEIRL